MDHPVHLYSNHRSAKGETPLFLAAREGRLDVVKYLTRKGANKTIPDVLGRSPAWISASRGQGGNSLSLDIFAKLSGNLLGKSIFFGDPSTYRVSHHLSDQGWVVSDFGSSTLFPILLGQIRVGQKRLGKWPRWWNTPINVMSTQPNPTQPSSMSRWVTLYSTSSCLLRITNLIFCPKLWPKLVFLNCHPAETIPLDRCGAFLLVWLE